MFIFLRRLVEGTDPIADPHLFGRSRSSSRTRALGTLVLHLDPWLLVNGCWRVAALPRRALLAGRVKFSELGVCTFLQRHHHKYDSPGDGYTFAHSELRTPPRRP